MSGAKRADAGAAVAGLFARPSATGGLAGRDVPAAAGTGRDDQSHASASAGARRVAALDRAARVRLGVELTDEQTAFLRGLSRPARTGGPRTLGSKFVAAGVLAAAIELLQDAHLDMHGVAAGDLAEMTARARIALIRAATTTASEETA